MSAFQNAHNCLNSLPPLEANEELACLCLPLERTGLVSGHAGYTEHALMTAAAISPMLCFFQAGEE